MKSLIDDISRKIYARQTTQYFLNGAPRSGKSFLLRQLKDQLSSYIPGIIVFGPLELDTQTIKEYGSWICEQMFQACFLDELISDESILENTAETWGWLSDRVKAPNKVFVILIDIQFNDYNTLGNATEFFSALRSLEPTDYRRKFKLHHILSGYWDHLALEKLYRDSNISLPYTVGHNYRHWGGLEVEDVIKMIPKTSKNAELFGRILHEISGGHAGIIQEILDQFQGAELGLEKTLAIVNELAQSSRTTERLVKAWSQLPISSLALLEKLLLHRNVPVSPAPIRYEQHLIAAGIASLRQIGKSEYLGFKSWYSELAARYHCEELNLTNEKLSRTRIVHITPEIYTLNVEAYRLIQDIEIASRNLVVVTLSNWTDSESDFLKGFKVYTNDKVQDLSDKARDQQENSRSKGLNTNINTIISYISTNELANLMEDMSYEYDLSNWKSIAAAMRQIAAIRNAVMHNQLIDERSLELLNDLRAKIYSATWRPDQNRG